MFLMVGASVRAIMESAAESGYEVIGIDFYGDVDAGWKGEILSLTGDCKGKPSVKHLLKTARKIPCTGLIYTSGPDNFPEEMVYWENRGLLLGNGEVVLRKVRNPWILSQSLKRIGASMPDFYPINEWGYLENNKNWLLKPLFRGGGHGIIELPRDNKEILDCIKCLSQPSQFIIQEYVEGIPASITFLADGYEALALGTSRQLMCRGEYSQFLYQGNIVPLNKGIMDPLAFEKEILKIISQLTKDFSLKGINTLDFIIKNKKIWILELNPRWSASVELIEKALGLRLFSAHLASCLGIKSNPLDNKRRISLLGESNFWGKSIVYAHADGTIDGFDEKYLRYLYVQGVRDIPRPGTTIRRGQPLCTVIAHGESDWDCNQRLEKKAWRIHRLLLGSKIISGAIHGVI